MNTLCYSKTVNEMYASKWVSVLSQRATVLQTTINGHPTLIGVAPDEDRWMGIYMPIHTNDWHLLISAGIMDRSTNFRAEIMAITGEGGWDSCAISFVDAIKESKTIRDNWDWNDDEVSEEEIAAVVGLVPYRDPAEELFEQLPEAIREAVYNRLPTVGALPGCTSRGETLEEVADFCVQVAAEQAARREADRLWDAWLSAQPPKPTRRRPRFPEGAKSAPRRRK